jgi:Bacterial Ig-like domain
MRKHPVISFFLFSALLIISIISGPGCANIIPPEGGFRDSLPPVLLKANPKDSALNFTGNKITFTFDEYVELQNIQQNLVITPIPQNNPIVESKLYSVTIKLKDSLESNTTYNISFGDAIKDITESNVLKNFTYRFSTGKALDSLTLSGKIILAETGKTDTTMIVMLHKNGKDSALMNEKPRYITKLNNNGEFIFQNLPSATYYLYAVKTEGGGYRYFGGNQLFAFADKPVTIQQKNDPVTLYAYAEKEEEKKKSSNLPSIGGGRGRVSGATGADKRLKYQTSIKEGKQDLLENFSFKFETPIKFFDSSKIYFSTDTTYKAVNEPFHWLLDSTKTKLELKTAWKENTLYNLIFETDFAEDTSGRRILKKDTISFRTREKNSYGELKLNFKNLDQSKNPVLQFVQNSSVILFSPLTTNQYSNSLINPGEYELRILFDENKNGVWDPGEFFGKRKQPELVKPIERKITVKTDRQNEFDITL